MIFVFGDARRTLIKPDERSKAYAKIREFLSANGL